MSAVVLFVVLAVSRVASLGGSFLPDFREGHFVLGVTAAPGTSLPETMRMGEQISKALLANPHIATVEQQIGRAELGEDTWGPNKSEFHVELKPLSGDEEAGVADEIRKLLTNVPGIQFRRISVPNARTGQPGSGLYIEITDYDAWRPAELNFWLLKLTCKLAPKNPFTAASAGPHTMFAHLVGSGAFINDLIAKGARVDVDTWLKTWREQAKIYQEQSRKYWLYR